MWTREATDRAAFYASVVVHALIVATLLHAELGQPIWLPAIRGERAGTVTMLTEPVTTDTAVVKVVPPEDPRFARFGEPDAKGYATSSSPGEQLMMAREGEQDQPWLSRDPIGPGPMPEEPSMSTARPGDGGRGGAGGGGGAERRMITALPESPALAPLGVGQASAESRPRPRIVLVRPAIAVVPPPAPTPPKLEPIAIREPGPATRPAQQAQPATRPANVTVAAVIPPAAKVIEPAPARATAAPQPPAQRPGAASASGRPGPRVPAADPAPMTEQESDPFARIGSVTIRAGRVEARLGRQAKLIKPRLTTKAQLDLISIIDPSVILKVSIDPTGKITDVDVIKSSGSNEIDLPAQLAMYKSWIEPRKDQAGNPVSDVQVVRFYWR